jgi:hypothetical protein
MHRTDNIKSLDPLTQAPHGSSLDHLACRGAAHEGNARTRGSMRVQTYVVPPCYLPCGAPSTAWPTPDGIEIYLAEFLPQALRDACVKAYVAAATAMRPTRNRP